MRYVEGKTTTNYNLVVQTLPLSYFYRACISSLFFVLQDLSRLGRDLRKVVIIDNSPQSYIFHPDNAVSSMNCTMLRACNLTQSRQMEVKILYQITIPLRVMQDCFAANQITCFKVSVLVNIYFLHMQFSVSSGRVCVCVLGT